MSSTLGEKMREAREERGITISEVAEQTRISPLYISCIEKDDYKPLPGGIFNKGFLKSYARYIGFDEHEALQEYSKLMAGAAVTQEEEFKSYRPEVLTDDRNAASMVPTIIFAGVILTLMTGGILFVLNYINNQPESSSLEANANTNANTAFLIPSDAVTEPQNSGVPTMDSLIVEFKTASVPISVSSITDGRSSVLLVTPEKPVVFEPKQTLRLAYSRSLASVARLTINGRDITLPQMPANPRRAAIELEINRDNISQVWENGSVSALAPPGANTATTAPRPAARQRPATTNSTVRPSATSPATARPSPR